LVFPLFLILLCKTTPVSFVSISFISSFDFGEFAQNLKAFPSVAFGIKYKRNCVTMCLRTIPLLIIEHKRQR